MKAIITIILVTTFGLISCKSDNPKEMIAKKWRVTDIDIPNMPLPDSTKGLIMRGTMEFTQGGKMLLTGMGNNKSGTYILSDDGKKLFVVTNGKTETNEIIELTNSKMILVNKTNNSRITVIPK